MLGKFSKKNLLTFFSSISLWAGGFGILAPPPGRRPWTPHAFGLRTLVETGSHSRHFSKKSEKFFHQNFFSSTFKKVFSKNCLNRIQKNFHRNQTKKKIWPHFSLFSHFKSTISQKLKIGKLFLFCFSFFLIAL